MSVWVKGDINDNRLREMKGVRSAPRGYGVGKLCRTSGDRTTPTSATRKITEVLRIIREPCRGAIKNRTRFRRNLILIKAFVGTAVVRWGPWSVMLDPLENAEQTDVWKTGISRHSQPRSRSRTQ